MSQSDLNVANGSGSVVRADINAHLDAIATLSSGATAPTTTFANMWWADTANNLLKRRNNANTAWISVMSLATGDLISSDTANVFTAQQTPLSAALTYNVTQTWDCSAAQDATLTLTGNVTTFSAPTNQVAGTYYVLRMNVGTGPYSVTAWNAVFKFPAGTAPTLSATASAIDILVFRSDGTNMELVGISQDVK